MSLRFPAFQNAVLRHPSWLRAGDLAFSTWVKLCCRCAEDENGGRLGGARTWNDRVWIPLANVTEEGVFAAVEAGLCAWDGDSLVVAGYDDAAQAKVQTLRNNGDFGHLGAEHGKKGGRPRKDRKPPGKPPEGVLQKPPLTLPIPTSPSEPTGPARADGQKEPMSAHRLFGRFKIAWAKRKGRLEYGRGGDRDSRALGELSDVIASLPAADRAQVDRDWDAMVSAFLDEVGETEKAGHLFSWFVARLNGYRAIVARRASGRPGGHDSELQEID